MSFKVNERFKSLEMVTCIETDRDRGYQKLMCGKSTKMCQAILSHTFKYFFSPVRFLDGRFWICKNAILDLSAWRGVKDEVKMTKGPPGVRRAPWLLVNISASVTLLSVASHFLESLTWAFLPSVASHKCVRFREEKVQQRNEYHQCPGCYFCSGRVSFADISMDFCLTVLYV